MKRFTRLILLLCILIFGLTACGVKESFNTSGWKIAPKSDSEGKKAFNVPGKPLSGLKICIDAGHGTTSGDNRIKEPVAPGSKTMKAAFATGTRGVYTDVPEAAVNLDVAKKLKERLTAAGAEVIMIRETSQCDLSNIDRAKLWNESGAGLTIRIHCNGIDDSRVSGILMMIPGEKYIKDGEMLERSLEAGQLIMAGVIKHTNSKSRDIVKSNDLTGFNWSKIPVVLIEMGFMTNPEEDRLLNNSQYQDKIAEGIEEGVQCYYNNLTRSVN